MKIGIIGYGFVGRATSLFSHPEFEYYIYDINPALCRPSNINFNDLSQCDIIFICLPTPMNIDGSCHTLMIEQTIQKLDHKNIIVRSTVPLGFCNKWNVWFMPEFLTEANWKDDFYYNQNWIIGVPKSISNFKNDILEEVIRKSKSNLSIQFDNVIYLKSNEAELVKLVKNSYLATKVSFFNEVYDLAIKKQIDYEKVAQVVGLDPRIGSSHLIVPCNGKRGYGGTCFPKDTNNLYSLFQESRLKSYLLESNLKRNEFVDRYERDWLKDNRTNTKVEHKIVLVTGGAGFIGSHLCERLVQEGNKVICIDNLSTGKIENIQQLLSNDNFVFRNQDITKTIFVPTVDEIYHLACPASPPQYQKDPLKTIKTSIKGLWNVLKICKQQKCKLLFTSTSEIYGDPLQHPQKEEYWGNVNPLGNRSMYDESKRLSETIINEYRKKHNLDLKIVRIFNTYGPKMDLNDGRIITNIIRAGKQNLVLTVNGKGNQTRSFCYIDDMIDGLHIMMQSQEIGPINLGNPNCEFTMNELIDLYHKLSGKEIQIKYELYDCDDPKQRKPDITKAKSKLNWEPIVSVKDGLTICLNSYSNQYD
jgi:Nucleoside-diphosphate-sugar epimerases